MPLPPPTTAPTAPAAKKRSGLGKALLVLFSLLIGLGICEIILRMLPKTSEFENLSDLRGQIQAGAANHPEGKTTLADLIQPDERDTVIFRLKPNLDVVFQDVPVRTNSAGLRDEEIPREKPDGEYRIVLLGDSFAFGWGVKKEESFADVLERELDRLRPGRRHQVVNLGVPGYSTFQETAVFKEEGIAYQPDAVLVFFVENDFGFPFFVRDFTGGGGLVDASRVASLVREMADPEAGQRKMKEMKLDANMALAELAAFCRERHLPLAVAINPGKTWEKDRRKLWSLDKNPDIRFIDLRTPLLEYIRRENLPLEKLTLPTDPHPSPLKHLRLGIDLAGAWFPE